jgi:hypothetical protein
VGPRAGLDDMQKEKFFALPRLELRSLGRSARSQPLYRLSVRVKSRKEGNSQDSESYVRDKVSLCLIKH